MSAATLSDAEVESAVLAATNELFFRRGIADVTMAEIRDAAGVSMRRLYSFAPSKSDLVARWLEHRHIAWTDGFMSRVDEQIAGGADVIDAIFGALSDWMAETNYRGCGFINTHSESGELTEEHRSIIRGHKKHLADYLSTLTPHGNAIAVLVDGAIVQASIFASSEPIGTAQGFANALHNHTSNSRTTP